MKLMVFTDHSGALGIAVESPQPDPDSYRERCEDLQRKARPLGNAKTFKITTFTKNKTLCLA